MKEKLKVPKRSPLLFGVICLNLRKPPWSMRIGPPMFYPVDILLRAVGLRLMLMLAVVRAALKHSREALFVMIMDKSWALALKCRMVSHWCSWPKQKQLDMDLSLQQSWVFIG
ncbi:hypothetical protein V6N12_073406 [Hibiscus sabdariffa]|uniref:Uncharacterized protein n=1 Tax=Hibiscus sabdariffa TaxID=183260 RepID=A0ABR1ZGD7_9ROSI